MSKVIARNTAAPKQDLSTIATAVAVGLPAPNPSVIASEVMRFASEGNKALDQAERLVVKDAKAAGVAADLVKAINTEVKTQEAARKAHTSPLDAFKTKLMGLFKPGQDRLDEAKKIILAKLQAFQTEERKRLEAEAEAQRAAQEAEAQRLAAAQAALGDAEGAQQIIDEAAELPVEPVKVLSTGSYGATAGSKKLPVGAVGDVYAFLRSIATDPMQPGYAEVINSIQFGQRELNALAKLVINNETPYPIGFDASERETVTVR